MIGTYAAAVLICGASVILGRGVIVAAGGRASSWIAPAVGFAALMIVCEVAIRLPGHAYTAIVALFVAVGASLLAVRWRGRGERLSIDGLPVGVALLAVASTPFVANARVGVLGISFLNDTHWHLLLAEQLRHPSYRALEPFGPGYPLGPHAIATTFAQLLGTGVDSGLTGMLMSVPVLTGLTALAGLGRIQRSRAWLVAVLAGVPYLAAAFYGESAFKEPILAMLILGGVLVLEQWRRERFARPATALALIAVLVAGVVYVYSYPGLLWPLVIGACWVLLWVVIGGGWRGLRGLPRAIAGARIPLIAAVVLLVVLVAPDIGRIHTFWNANGGTSTGTGGGGIDTSSLANLAGPLNWLESLGMWFGEDFRLVPHGGITTAAFAGFALVVLVFALARSLDLRRVAWPAAILACGLIYLWAKHNQSPYVAAKALVIDTPLIALGSGRALMEQLEGMRLASFTGVAFVAAVVVYFGAALGSSYLVLRGSQVGPNDHTNELRSLRPLLHGKPTLVLFYDDYFKWELLGVPSSSPLPLGPVIPAVVQPAKPWSYGQALDFDSVDAPTLDRFDYVITTRTSDQSEPPANFHQVGQSRSYIVWQRSGPTQPRKILAESGQPGAFLDCRKPAGLALSRQTGVARVRPAPLSSPPLATLAPGQSTQVRLRMPPGQWDVSLPFVSPQAVTVTGAGLHTWLPPNLDRPG
ncbi:MAG: hypothetical protein ACXVRH_10385, partial [Thermoleophilaceae bacterium]